MDNNTHNREQDKVIIARLKERIKCMRPHLAEINSDNGRLSELIDNIIKLSVKYPSLDLSLL